MLKAAGGSLASFIARLQGAPRPAFESDPAKWWAGTPPLCQEGGRRGTIYFVLWFINVMDKPTPPVIVVVVVLVVAGLIVEALIVLVVEIVIQ